MGREQCQKSSASNTYQEYRQWQTLRDEETERLSLERRKERAKICPAEAWYLEHPSPTPSDMIPTCHTIERLKLAKSSAERLLRGKCGAFSGRCGRRASVCVWSTLERLRAKVSDSSEREP
jgi:hypothetical protein